MRFRCRHCCVRVIMRPSGYFLSPRLALGAVWVEIPSLPSAPYNFCWTTPSLAGAQRNYFSARSFGLWMPKPFLQNNWNSLTNLFYIMILDVKSLGMSLRSVWVRGKESKNYIAANAAPTVQRMSPEPVGRAKRYAPVDTRVSVPFGRYTELSLKNVECAREEYFQQPKTSCDVLSSDRGQ